MRCAHPCGAAVGLASTRTGATAWPPPSTARRARATGARFIDGACPDGCGESHLRACLLDLAPEDLRVGRVRHGTNGVEDAARHPGRPRLVVVVQRLGLVRHYRRGDDDARTRLPCDRAEPDGQGVEGGPPVAPPAFGIERRSGQEVAAPARRAEGLEGRARPVVLRARIAHEVEVQPVHGIAAHDLGDDLLEMRRRLRSGRGEVQAFRIARVAIALDQGDEARGRRAQRLAGRFPRDHEPIRVAHGDVARRQGQAEVRGEEHIHPGVHLEAALASAREQAPERIEVRGLAPKELAALHHARCVEGIPAAAHLHEEGIESGAGGPVHDLIDGFRGQEACADDPQAAHLRRGWDRWKGRPGEEEGEEDDHPVEDRTTRLERPNGRERARRRRREWPGG